VTPSPASTALISDNFPHNSFVYKGIEMAWFAHEMEDVSSGMMQMPLWIPWSIVPIGGFLLTLQFINKLAQDFQNLKQV